MNRRPSFLVAGLVAALILVGCGSSDDDSSAPSETTAGADTDSCATLPLVEDGTLTVATGEEVYPPWVEGDDPASGEGFESAVVYALADELGIENVEWTGTTFDGAIAPGEKDYDFNLQQYSITPDRLEVVDFSRGYYDVQQALIAPEGSTIADAETLEDLKGAKLGAAIGTTSLDYAENVIDPDAQVQVFDDNAAAKAAFDAGHIDGLVLDLPTAYYVTAVEIEDAEIIGTLPTIGDTEQFGLLFEKGSPLVPCVDEALDALDSAGTLDALRDEWLSQGGDIRALTE